MQLSRTVNIVNIVNKQFNFEDELIFWGNQIKEHMELIHFGIVN